MANNASSRGAASSPLLAISTRCPSGGEGSSFITHGLLQTSPRRQRIARICRHEGATVDVIFRRWGRSVTVPSMTGVPTSDRHSFLDGGRSDQAASSLRTEDQSAPRSLLCRGVYYVVLGGRVFLRPVEAGHGLSLGFPRIPC